MRKFRFGPLFAIIFSLFYINTGILAQTNKVCTTKNAYILKPFDGPLKNPHKGFCVPTGGTWSFSPEWEYAPGGSRNNEAWDVISHGTGYQRWDKLNPSKGVYNWTDLDNLLNACEQNGVGYGLRVFPYSTLKGVSKRFSVETDYDMTPQFVYAEGARKNYARYTYENQVYTIAIPDWNDPIYLQAHKDFAAALAAKYDGDPRLEYIDIRCFGNWGEWHTSHIEGGGMATEEVQKEMLSYYASVFHKTLLVLPSSGSGDVYKYALNLGITKRDDGLIGTPKRENTLVPAYEANLPTIGENISTYSVMLQYNDNSGYLRWTVDRWKNVITTAHLTYYVLDQDSDAGFRFYNDNKANADSMSKIIGYNFRITKAELLTVTDDQSSTSNTLNITVKNTGVAPCFFDVYMVAELVDNNGSVLTQLGQTIVIPKGTFKDGMSKDFEFTYVVPFWQTNLATKQGVSIALSLYESENAYRNGKNPTVRFDNDGLQKNNKLLLTSHIHSFGNWNIIKEATNEEPGLRRHVCESCGSYEEEIFPLGSESAFRDIKNVDNEFDSYVVDNTIYVSNVEGKTVCLYNSKGELCDKKYAMMNELQFSVQHKGVYIIMVNNQQDTVIVK